MNLFALAPLWQLGLLCALLLAAAIQDSVRLRISNLISGSIAALALVAAVISPGAMEFDLWRNLLAFAAVLAIGTILHARSILGGGDVKLFAAVALWAGDVTALTLVAAILIAGGLLALLIIAVRTLLPARAKRSVPIFQRGAGIPYGVAIALGTVAAVAISTPNSTAQDRNREPIAARP